MYAAHSAEPSFLAVASAEAMRARWQAVPNMFRDTDELTLEYKNEQSRWVRVKMKTPVDAVKAARSARITVPAPRGSSRAVRR